MPTPPHRDPRLLALVAAGGALGTLARYGTARLVPAAGAWPLATLAVNVAGSFLLGLLLEALARRGPEDARGTALRLGLGTGFCGGFTTFSSLAVEVDGLLSDGTAGTALAYGAGSVAAGLLAALAGVAVAGSRHRGRPA
ncbi:fluoride efflux transporter FluC [Kineococcus rubinsiae]|uniref:fluoride efflux transporter FluC n=1 Tax=Kineococcus rubinsiae TaxID=2609562 RepID=UPI001AD8EBA2|nr:CrcB family protein [Kineococcus rubinsiae]